MKRKLHRAGIRDVAREAGVANVTVSNILNKRPLPYSEKTRKRVLQAAKKLRYRPSAIARSMRTRKTHVVGILVPDALGHYFSEIISAVEKNLWEKGYQVFLCQSHGDLKIHQEMIDALQQRSVDGLLISVIDSFAHNRLYRQLAASDIPVVLFDSKTGRLPIPVVESNQMELTRRAVEHLWELGHRQICFFNGRSRLLNARERLRGFVEALRARGVDSPEQWAIETGYREEDGIQGFDHWVKSGRSFSAIITSIYCGYGIIQRARERGWRIPEDLSLVTLGGGREAERMELTDLDQRPREIGRRMSELLIHILQHGDKKDGESLQMVEPIFHARRSTAPFTGKS